MSRGYTKEDIEGVYKTHFGEQSLIVLEIDRERNSNYTETAIIKIHDQELTPELIENWIQSVPRFRDVFIYEKVEQPVRVRLKKLIPSIEFIEGGIQNMEHAIERIESQDFQFDIQKGPLFKVIVFNGDDCQYLACAYHHLLFDGISIQHVFASLITQTPVSTNEWLPRREKKELFEKKETVGFHLQNFIPPPLNDSSGFLYENLVFEKFSYQEIMSKWISFLFLVSGQDNVCIGEVFSMRNSELTAQNALGYFVQTWPLQFFRHENNSIEALERKRTEVLTHSDQAVQDYFMHGLFDHCWVVEPELKSEYETIFRSKPHYLLSIVIQPSENSTSLCFVWNTAKICSDAAKEIVQSFHDFISPNNHSELIPERTYELKPILDIWRENLKLHPNKRAIKDSYGNEFSYQNIEDLSNKLATTLEIEIQEPIGIRTSNSGSLIVAMLAVLKRRGIYVPLDPDISEERLQYILKDAGIQTILSDLTAIPNIKTIHPIQHSEISSDLTMVHPELTDICYLIYTSGTTGQPKGCCVTHANLSNLFVGSLAKFNFTQDERWIMAHSYGFDFSTWEIWGALLNGGSLYIPERMQVKDSFTFYDLLLTEKITVLNQTPKAFENLMLVGENNAKLSDLKYLIFGGDKLNTQKIASWQEQNKHVALVNMYGITETTVHVTFKEIKGDKYSNIGKALPGYSIQLKNERNEKVPNGFLGEIIVEGDGVCRGYYKKEDLTKEKFNFASTPSYKSGDIGWKMQGDFFYLGRNDRQIKIRGHRIELGEIEHLLQNKFGSLFRTLFIDNQTLVAFHTCSVQIDRASCKEILPDYANPSLFIQLDSIPLNINGKTDEKALIQIYVANKKKVFHQTEAVLFPYISKLLGDNVSEEKSFIENGGDSISAIRLVNSIRKDGLSISIQDLFAASSIKDIEIQGLDNLNSIQNNWRNNPEIEQFNLANHTDSIGIFPLTEAQNGILFDSLIGNESVYSIQLTYHVSELISTESLVHAYTQVMGALPALQLQLIQWEEHYKWTLPKNPVVEINVLPENKSIEEILLDDFKKPFDFSKNLIRLTIVEKENAEKVLIWTHHHLLMDGWSLGIFSKLLFQSLNGESPQRKESYLNFLYNQSISNKLSQLNFWNNRLKKCTLEPLIPYLSVGEKSQAYGEHITKISAIKIWKDLSFNDLTQNQFVFAAWISFVSQVFQKNSLSCGRVHSLREESLEDEVGMLIQTLPFTCELNRDQSFLSVAKQLKNQLIEDNTHQDIPLSNLDGINLNLDSLFVFENYPIDKSLTEDSIIKIGDFREKTGAKWTFICYPNDDGIKIRILYQKDYYPQEYVVQLIERFSEYIQHLNWNESIQENAKSILNQPSINGETIELVDSSNLFEHFWKKSNSLILNSDGDFSQSDIEFEVKKIAKELYELGLSMNEAVGIDVHSTKHFIESVLAIWQLGAVPCSVDFRYPEQRKAFIWENASCRFVLTDKNGQLRIIKLDREQTLQPENASFILHTSGSTGIPKGVIQTKDCLIHLAHWTAHKLNLSDTDRILALSSFGFDASYHELILWLELGATIVEMPFDKRQDIQEIRTVIINQKVTLAWIPARMLNMILETDDAYFDKCHTLKQIVTTGEALIIGDALMRWVERKNIRLFNFYGPTETHVVTAKVVDKFCLSKIPTIGFPISNAEIGLFDQKGNEVPKGLIGEIWISGPYLAHGYLNDETLTNERFVIRNGQRWYKSGDSGWIGDDGRIEYLGRLDNQIKIRGFRVEPYEVESILHSVRGIEQAAIAIDRSDEVKLVAFCTGKNMTDNEFRQACSELMPEFMIPEIYVCLEELPRNINGKIDRETLLKSYHENKIESINEIPITNAYKCWEAVLGHTNFGAHSHFLTVGGSSLRIMRMQAWLEKNYQISIPVQELIVNQTIKELDNLILEKQQEFPFEIPNKIPLNPLQRAILLSESGNTTMMNSPFILGFTCESPVNILEKDLHQAVENLFIVYPHLSYVLSKDVEIEEIKWEKCADFMKFVHQPLNSSSLSNLEPLLRIFLENEVLHVQWHHILLDGVGISMVMEELYGLLTSNKSTLTRNYSLFLNHFSFQNNAKTDSSNGAPLIFERKIEKSELEKLAEKNELSLLDLFLLLSHSIFDQTDSIGFTDNTQQIGIPGMFTFLNTSTLSDAIESKSCLLKGRSSDKTVAMVTNFMYRPDLPDSRFVIKNKELSTCKYPYELQIEVSQQIIQIQFIGEQTNPFLHQKSTLFFENLEKLLIDQTFDGIFPENHKKSTVDFDEFDF
jgi:amino acid adenylation domain-containing protein